MHYVRPTTLASALDLLADDASTIPVAGGTDVYPAHVGRPIGAPVLDLSHLDELRGIETGSDRVRIGALTTWSEIAAAALPTGLAALQQAAVEVGGKQVQNVATIGGNLCNASPAADGVPPLLAVDAEVELASSEGVRQIALHEFLVGYRATARRPDELVTAVVVPIEAAAGRSSFSKLGSRRYLVISIVMVAARVVTENGTVTDAAVAVGACSPVALRLHTYEQALIGAPVDGLPATTDDHLTALTPIDDSRAPAGYRLDASKTLVDRTVAACLR